jgi:DNA gyrase subunit A
VIRLIRGSENARPAKDGLMREFGLSEIQATYILDTPLRRLTKYDRLELESEQDNLRAEIAELSGSSTTRRAPAGRGRRVGRGGKALATERRTSLIDGDLKEVLAASKPAGRWRSPTTRAR